MSWPVTRDNFFDVNWEMDEQCGCGPIYPNNMSRSEFHEAKKADPEIKLDLWIDPLCLLHNIPDNYDPKQLLLW